MYKNVKSSASGCKYFSSPENWRFFDAVKCTSFWGIVTTRLVDHVRNDMSLYAMFGFNSKLVIVCIYVE